VIRDEGFYHLTCFFIGLLSFIGRELTLGGTVREVVQNFFDVLWCSKMQGPRFSSDGMTINSLESRKSWRSLFWRGVKTGVT
jgi:hypothetical protein